MMPIAACRTFSEGIFNYILINTLILEGQVKWAFTSLPPLVLSQDLVIVSPPVKRFLLNTKCFSKRLNSLSNLEI